MFQAEKTKKLIQVTILVWDGYLRYRFWISKSDELTGLLQISCIISQDNANRNTLKKLCNTLDRKTLTKSSRLLPCPIMFSSKQHSKVPIFAYNVLSCIQNETSFQNIGSPRLRTVKWHSRYLKRDNSYKNVLIFLLKCSQGF